MYVIIYIYIIITLLYVIKSIYIDIYYIVMRIYNVYISFFIGLCDTLNHIFM